MARRLRDVSRGLLLGGIGLVAAIALALTMGRTRAPRTPALAGPELRIPRATSAVTIDGEVTDAAWQGPFATTGVLASVDGRPTTDSTARLAWRGGETPELYLLLYAADSDIHASVTTPDAPLWPEDAFRIAFTRPGDPRERVLYVSPIGTLTDAFVRGDEVDTSWSSHARVAHDLDGTPNDPRDDDEEWVIEMAIPLASLGMRGEPGERIGFSVRRCDAPKGTGRRCGAWGEPSGQIVLE